MKTKLLLSSMLGLAVAIQAQVTTTVSVGAGYADQKWYSLENGIQATQSKDNWDLAFEVTGYSSAILANTQKANFAIYKTPYNIAAYTTLDTAGISTWPLLYNSDTTWTIGALNRGANPSNANDLGWGIYDLNTHFVNGDSCYVIKISAAVYKKLKVVNLASGVYNFEYADINGANSQTAAINKTNYTGKNFAYYNLATNTAVDREPVSSAWDLTFSRYTAILMMPSSTAYPVVGVLANKGVRVAQMNNVANPASMNTWYGQTYESNISTLGHDWKAFDLGNNVWRIAGDTVYFIKDKPGNIWKLRFMSFGGSITGDFVFSQEKLSMVGIGSVAGSLISKVSVYPNPANSSSTLLFSAERSFATLVTITDLSGKIMSNETVQVAEGLTSHPLNLNGFGSGIYIVKISGGGQQVAQKLIVE